MIDPGAGAWGGGARPEWIEHRPRARRRPAAGATTNGAGRPTRGTEPGANPVRRGEEGDITLSNTTRAFEIDRAATVADIGRYETALERVLLAVEAFSDLPEGQALRTARQAHAAAQAELEAADAALFGDIRRLHRQSLSPAVLYRGILYVPVVVAPVVDDGARGRKMRFLRVMTNYDILKLD